MWIATIHFASKIIREAGGGDFYYSIIGISSSPSPLTLVHGK